MKKHILTLVRNQIKDRAIIENYKLVGVAMLFLFLPFLGCKGSKSSGNLKTYEDLEAYLDQEGEIVCDNWKTACAYNNTSKRWEAQLQSDGTVNRYDLEIIPLLVRNNDLSESFIEKAREHWKMKMEQCGWSYDREKWPGYKKE